MSADLDIVAYLASKGYQGRPTGGREVVYPCFLLCDEPKDSRKRKLYVNPEEGLYHCKVCDSVGGTYLLQKHFGDDPKVRQLPGVDTFTRRKILSEAAELGMEMLTNNDDLLLYLISDGDTALGPGRGLSPQTVIDKKLGCVANNWSLIGSLPNEYRQEEVLSTGLVYKDGPRKGKDFWYNHLLIPYLRRGQVAQIRGRAASSTMQAKYQNGPGEDHQLYNADALDGAEDVIITEGEFDCMKLEEILQQAPEDRVRKIAVVGLAGVGAIPKGFEDYFSQAKRVYIGLDPDDAGARCAVKIKEMLGTKARIIELPQDAPKCDWTEFIVRRGATWRDVIDLMGAASGKRLYSVREAGHAYRTARETGTGVQTGYVSFDSIIQPGLLPGQVTVVLAKTGTGKTVLLCNLAYNMSKQKCLFISLEMTREEVYERLRRIYLFWHPDHNEEMLEHALCNVMICDENRLSEKDLDALVDEFEVESGYKPEVVYIDYLGYFARGARGNSPYEKTTNAVMALKAVAKDKRIHIVAPHQVSRLAKEGKPIDMDDARDSGAVEETADFLLSIWRPDEALIGENQQQSGKVKLSILKSRHGGKGRTFTLVMDLLTLAIVEDGTPEARRATDHNHLAWRGQTWNDLRRAETTPVQRELSLAGGRKGA